MHRRRPGLRPGALLTLAVLLTSPPATAQAAPTAAPPAGPTTSSTASPFASPTTAPTGAAKALPDAAPAPGAVREAQRAATAAAADGGAVVDDVGCRSHVLEANDDSSTEAVTLPFVATFYGVEHTQVHVNNNGTVTFDAPWWQFSPAGLADADQPVIAPFLADIDTRSARSDEVTYGTTTYHGRTAFCVNWVDVGYYPNRDDLLNSVQMLLVDRGERGAGDLDVVLNYDTVQWDTGIRTDLEISAAVGFTAGDGDPAHLVQLAGSLVPGALLDTAPTTGLVHRSRGSQVPGRYVFAMRTGHEPGPAGLQGTVLDGTGEPATGAVVQACATAGTCLLDTVDAEGGYRFDGLPTGTWTVQASPPVRLAALPTAPVHVSVHEAGTALVDLALGAVAAPPAGTSITSHGTVHGVPVVHQLEDLDLQVAACTGGEVQYTLADGTGTVRSGALAETSAGTWTATVPALHPAQGVATVTTLVGCPDGTRHDASFAVHVAPTGTVLDTAGDPVVGATVTLLRADDPDGPFEALPDGSTLLGAAVPTDPVVTGDDGTFARSALAGHYRLRVTRPGCTAPGGDAALVSDVLQVPPSTTGVTLVLDCGGGPTGRASLTTVQLPPGQPMAGVPVQVTATVAGAPGTALPTGTVAFTADGTGIDGCAAQGLVHGAATCTTTFAHATDHETVFTAVYTGDAAHDGSTSAAHRAAVARRAPVVTWERPAAVRYPTALDGTQLRARADVPGTFTYELADGSPADGAVPRPGRDQVLVARFTPDDPADVASTTATTRIAVRKGLQVIMTEAVPDAMLTDGTVVLHDADTGSSSGLPVQVAAEPDTVCVADEDAEVPDDALGVVRLVGPGQCWVRLERAGNDLWTAADPMWVVFDVHRRPLPEVAAMVHGDAAAPAGVAQVRSPRVGPVAAGTLVLAFVSGDALTRDTDEQSVVAVEGGGLVWEPARVQRSGTGTAEIWQARTTEDLDGLRVAASLARDAASGSITVATFTGEEPTVVGGATADGRGTPALTVERDQGESLVWAVGVNGTVAAQVGAGAGQTLVHRWAPRRAAATTWVQTADYSGEAAAPEVADVDLTTRGLHVGPWSMAAVEIATVPGTSGAAPAP